MNADNKKDRRRSGQSGEVLLEIHGLRIEGQSEDVWHEIVKGIDLTLRRGEVLGLIGESGAGKSTIGLAAMGYARPGCRISAGEIRFDGVDLSKASEDEKRKIWGARIAYVAQSAAAAFNPAHILLSQYAEAPLTHGLMGESEVKREAVDLFRRGMAAGSRASDREDLEVSRRHARRPVRRRYIRAAEDLSLLRLRRGVSLQPRSHREEEKICVIRV